MDTVSTKGMNKADVLAALYNASKPQGLGILVHTPDAMTRERAQGILDTGDTDFDYLQGRVMKVDLTKDDSFNPWLYDRDNGEGAAFRAVSALTFQSN